MKTVVVSGALANKPWNGGNAWTRLAWILTLRNLGFDVCFIEQINHAVNFAQAVEYFRRVTRYFCLAAHSVLLMDDGTRVCGMPMEELRRRIGKASALINISGHLTVPALKHAIPVRIYYDDDPGYTQMWHAAGDPGPRLPDHDLYYTLGMRIGKPDCPIPSGDIPWRPTLPPVYLGQWPVMPVAAFDRFTSVASWRGPYPPMAHQGRVYGLKVHEFRKVLELPRRSGIAFELALNIHPADQKDERALRENGWRLVDPRLFAGTPDAYRRYIQQSSAEFSVAQGIYTQTRCGWFSDRTARYLASGKPALVQDTGIGEFIPTGKGLVTFNTLDEAVEGAFRITRDYPEHCRNARRIAESHLNGVDIIRGILQEAGVLKSGASAARAS